MKRSRAGGRTVSDVPQQVADAVERVEREREGGGELERRLEPSRELCKGRRRRQRERKEVSVDGGKGARRLSGGKGCLEGEGQSLAKRKTDLPVSLTSGPPSPASSSVAPDAAQPDAPESLPARVRAQAPLCRAAPADKGEAARTRAQPPACQQRKKWVRTRDELDEVGGVDRRVDRVEQVSEEAEVHADREADAGDAVGDREIPGDLRLVDGKVGARGPGEPLRVEERDTVGDREMLDGRGGLGRRGRGRRPRGGREERPAGRGEWAAREGKGVSSGVTFPRSSCFRRLRTGTDRNESGARGASSDRGERQGGEEERIRSVSTALVALPLAACPAAVLPRRTSRRRSAERNALQCLND